MFAQILKNLFNVLNSVHLHFSHTLGYLSWKVENTLFVKYKEVVKLYEVVKLEV